MCLQRKQLYNIKYLRHAGDKIKTDIFLCNFFRKKKNKQTNSIRLYILYFGNYIWEQKNEIIAELVKRFNYYCDNIFTTFIFFFVFLFFLI